MRSIELAQLSPPFDKDRLRGAKCRPYTDGEYRARLTSTMQNGQMLSYSYDALSRLLSETGQVTASKAVAYQYDAASRRTRITWPGATSLYVQYGYDLTGAMTTVMENGTTSLATYAYDNLGRRASIARGNGASTSYGYDGASRLTSLVQNLSGTAQDLTQTFTYDPAGGIRTTATSNSLYEWSLGADFSDDYTANGLNQILDAGGGRPRCEAARPRPSG